MTSKLVTKGNEQFPVICGILDEQFPVIWHACLSHAVSCITEHFWEILIHISLVRLKKQSSASFQKGFRGLWSELSVQPSVVRQKACWFIFITS